MIVSLTGATGFVGWRAAEAFRDAGWQVRAIVRPQSTKPLPEGVEAAQCPLEAGALTKAFAGSGVVVHAAGLIRAASRAAFDAVNVSGTEAVVAAANATGARLVLISSQAAAGPGTPDRPTREEDPPKPLNAYGESKVAAEAVVRAASTPPWTILRPTAVYGPRDRGFLPLFRMAAHGVFPLIARPTSAFTLVHIDDLARAIVLAATNDRAVGETLFVGHAVPRTVDEVLRGLAAACGRTYRPLRIPAAMMAVVARAGDAAWFLGVKPMVDSGRRRELSAEGFVCSVARASEVLAFSASTDWLEGAGRTAQWYRDHRWV